MISPTYENMLKNIQSASGAAELQQIRKTWVERASLPDFSEDMTAYMGVVNRMHDELITKTVQIAEHKLLEIGFGAPPAKYAFMLFGSGGRQEQTMTSDQDNGIIYEDMQDETTEAAAKSYFLQLGQEINKQLEQIGYPPCTGKVLAGESNWCRPLAAFCTQLDHWFSVSDWESVRYLLIVADTRHLYGDQSISDQWMAHFHRKISDDPSILRSMAKNTLKYPVSLNVFGKPVRERYGEMAGGIEIKYGAYIPFVNGIRLLAVEAGIVPSSTLVRIDQLKRHVLHNEQWQSWKQAFQLILLLRTMTDIQYKDGLYVTENIVPDQMLTKQTMQLLSSGLRSAKQIQQMIEKRFIR